MKPSIGRIVHFQINEHEHRAAVITRVFESEGYATGYGCNLTVFLDAGNDARLPEQVAALEAVGLSVEGPGLAFGSSREQGSGPNGLIPGTWRWPPRA